jgi:hypothetical protein
VAEKSELLRILERALLSPLGVKIVTTEADALRRQFYALRATTNREDFNQLVFRISPHSGSELWIIKQQEENQCPSDAS